MPIYKLTRIDDAIGWDEYDSKIVRALNENQARTLADEKTGDEGQIWKLRSHVVCREITESGPAKVLLASFNAG